MEFILYSDFKSFSSLIIKYNLDTFIYYFNFKLIIYSLYNSTLLSKNLKGHIFKHLTSYKGNIKANKATSLVTSFNSLEIETLPNSLDLVLKFQEINLFFYFKELKIESLLKCLACNQIFKS